jgi:hypothetical protein
LTAAKGGVATAFLSVALMVALVPAVLVLEGSRGLDTGRGVGDLVAGRLECPIVAFATAPASSVLSDGRMGFGVEPRRGTGESLLVGALGCLATIDFGACALAVT